MGTCQIPLTHLDAEKLKPVLRLTKPGSVYQA